MFEATAELGFNTLVVYPLTINAWQIGRNETPQRVRQLIRDWSLQQFPERDRIYLSVPREWSLALGVEVHSGIVIEKSGKMGRIYDHRDGFFLETTLPC